MNFNNQEIKTNTLVKFQSGANNCANIVRDRSQTWHGEKGVDSGAVAFDNGVKEEGVVAKEGREREGGREGIAIDLKREEVVFVQLGRLS